MPAYSSIGGGSPIVQYTTAQARALEEKLRGRFPWAKCYVGMRYWYVMLPARRSKTENCTCLHSFTIHINRRYPFTEQALAEIVEDEVNTLVILPLYPQFSISTSGSSLRILQEVFAKDSLNWNPQRILHTVVPSWYSRPGYLISVANLIRKELAQFTNEDAAEGGLHVLFSAHGVPRSYISAGDPYQRQMVECVDLITRLLPVGTTVWLSYQSRVGPVEWLRPYTDDMLRELGTA